MKIGFFTDVYLPNAFGTEISIETFRKKIGELGHQVYVFAPFFPKYKDTNPRVFRFRSLKIIEKPEMRFAFPFLPTKSLKKILNIKLDIVHAHTPFNLGLLGKLVASRERIPIIYTHHTQYPEYTKVYFKEKILLPKMAKTWCAWYANQADVVLVPSHKIKKLLKDCKVKKPIAVLPTGIDSDLFKKSLNVRECLRKELGIGLDKKILLFVGRISKEKNPVFLFSVLKIILRKRDDVILLMVGGGSELERLRILAKNLKIDRFVKFTDQVPRSEIPAFYQAADVFVFLL